MDENENLQAQIVSFIEQARRRFQEKLASQQQQQVEDYPLEPDFSAETGFSFELAKQDAVPDIDAPFRFAVGPNDPRFYDDKQIATLKGLDAVLPVEMQQQSTKQDATPVDYGIQGNDLNEGGPYFRIKGPLNVNPKQPEDNIYKSKEMQGLLQKLGHNINGAGFENRMNLLPNPNGRHDVIQRPVDVEQNSVGLYAVALIAGVSAAITVGLIALGVGWYT